MKKTIKSSNKYKKGAITGLISTFFILIALNIIFSFIYFRIDLTKDNRHSLSPATISLLKELDDRVYIRVYLKGDALPADYQYFAKNTKDVLQDFRNYSNKVFFEFIDPVAGKSQEEIVSIFGEFGKKGLMPIPITTESSAGFSTQYVVPGVIISYHSTEKPVTLVVADPGGNESWLTYSTQELEYNLVSAIRSLVKDKRPKVAFVEGHGELGFMPTSWIAYQLQRFYQVERISIDGKVNALREIAIQDSVEQTIVGKGNKYDALIIAQPTQAFSDQDKYIIDQHIMRGGKVLWLIDATTAATDSFQYRRDFFATTQNLRLNDIFFRYGVRINTNLLQDLSCQSIPVISGQIGDQMQTKLMAFPYALNVVNFSTHPIVRNMKSIKSDFVSSIDLVGGQEVEKTILMTSSERTKMVPVPSIVTLSVGLTKPNLEEFAFKRLPIAVLVEGVFESAYKGLLPPEFDAIKEFGFVEKSTHTRQIFVSDGDIIRNQIDKKNGYPYPTGYDIYTQTKYDNSEFIMNCINYLCADDDLLQIRTKNFRIGKLDKIKILNKSTFYAVINIVVPLLLIAIMGVVANIIKRSKYRKLKKSKPANG